MNPRTGPRFDLRQSLGKGILGLGGVVVHLQAGPETLGHAKESPQAQARVDGDGPFASDNLPDAALRRANFLRQSEISRDSS